MCQGIKGQTSKQEHFRWFLTAPYFSSKAQALLRAGTETFLFHYLFVVTDVFKKFKFLSLQRAESDLHVTNAYLSRTQDATR